MRRPVRDRRPAGLVLEGGLVVVSPHLDDAVFSLGAAIARAVRTGATVTVLTVFAGDPDSNAPSAWWDRRAGFSTEGEAARARRDEDRTACGILGAHPVWLPFSDASYEPALDDEALGRAVREALDEAGVVLVPGYPLWHVDHLRLTRIALEGRWGSSVGLYVEQPYAKWAARRRLRHRPALPPVLEPLVARPVTWTRLASDRADRRTKRRAALAYGSQLPLFGRGGSPLLGRLLLRRIALYEALRGGEAVAWLD
jgi:LmbE family N-acetylglucosaminyl deacetylase